MRSIAAAVTVFLSCNSAAFALSCAELERMQADYSAASEAFGNLPPGASAQGCNYMATQISLENRMLAYRKFARQCGDATAFSVGLATRPRGMKIHQGYYRDFCANGRR